MGWIAIAAQVAGTVMQYQAQRQQAKGYESMGDAAAQQGLMEQQILDQNAKLKERQAAAELVRSREEARQFGREGEALLAGQQVALAKGGVLTSSGSPTNLLEYTANELENDRMNILREGFLAQSFALSEAENLKYQGRVAVVRGLNEQQGYEYQAKGAKLAAVGTLLTGSGSVYGTNSMKSTNKDSYLKWKYGV